MDSCNVTFPHPVFRISRPIILIELPQLTNAFVATAGQVHLSTILWLIIVEN